MRLLHAYARQRAHAAHALHNGGARTRFCCHVHVHARSRRHVFMFAYIYMNVYVRV